MTIASNGIARDPTYGISSHLQLSDVKPLQHQLIYVKIGQYFGTTSSSYVTSSVAYVSSESLFNTYKKIRVSGLFHASASQNAYFKLRYHTADDVWYDIAGTETLVNTPWTMKTSPAGEIPTDADMISCLLYTSPSPRD